MPEPYSAIDHYTVEKGLADRLRHAPSADRGKVYSEVYDELFRLVPGHPQLARRDDAAASHRELSNKMRLLGRFLGSETDFIEIGAGDCVLSRRVSRSVRSVVAIDVSAEVGDRSDPPGNFRFVITDGRRIPVPDESADLVYSNQLMEHIHPDDALAQLADIHRVLKPGGGYLLITPSRLTGPHDISREFDDRATGLHLHEYTFGELSSILRRQGFTRFRVYAGGRGHYVRVPTALVRTAESLFDRVPLGIRRRLRDNYAVRAVFGVNLFAEKGISD